MKRIIIVVTFFLTIVWTAATADAPAIPPNAVQILDEDFESGEGGWSFSDEYSYITEDGYLSDHALGQGFSYESGITTATHHLAGIDFSNYDEPVWLKRCHRVFTWELTPNIQFDVGEGSFYTKTGMSVAYMWRLSNLDNSQGWWESNCITYELHGLTAWGDQLDLVLSAFNSDDSPTTFYYDNIEIWAVPKFRVFLPIVNGGG
jgi:hypothetical protein